MLNERDQSRRERYTIRMLIVDKQWLKWWFILVDNADHCEWWRLTVKNEPTVSGMMVTLMVA